MRKQKLLLFILICLSPCCWADEGMWIPMLLKKYNIEDMQKKGFKLSAEDIYDINNASLKDAVVGLGMEGAPFQHFCTGELISGEGLMVTNHHCAFDMIQSHTSLENNYLRDGFWAKNKGEELANPGITASILVRMEDVTEQINAVLQKDMTEQERSEAIRKVSKELTTKAVEGTDLAASIKPYFNGNQFFMSVFRIFKDVRLVGAPPSAVGKFGGDTDNWVWPRHTGDFSVLRIYAGKDNAPAAYSPENEPYRPASHLKVSRKGLYEGDFTMVFGYPGTTVEYLPSYAIEQVSEYENPHKIAIRTAKLDIINEAMNTSELLRIQYAAKAANVANAWKKWQGESKGLKRFQTVANKQKMETAFQQWAQGKPEYENVLGRFRQLYEQRKDLVQASVYVNEAGKRGAEIVGFASYGFNAARNFEKATDKEAYKEGMKRYAADFYKDYDAVTDERILVEMLNLYNRNLPQEWIPVEVAAAAKKGKGDCTGYVRELFKKSVFANPERLNAFIENMDAKSFEKLQKDPAWILSNSINDFNLEKISPDLTKIDRELVKLNRVWMAGQMEMQPEKVFYPDANSTLRVAYGNVGGYSPADGVYYKHYTTLKGIIEKDNPEIYDYDVPQKLRDIYASKDFGPYTQDGEVPVCFIASNHTTGGNSGSPVLNAEGHLIGINFDRAWDGVMSDMQYDPVICRNIAVDIRYVLFIIDKLGGAGHLLDEMDIIE